MTRKTRRELAREIEDLRDDDLVDEVTAPADATVLPTESDIVTVWSEHMD